MRKDEPKLEIKNPTPDINTLFVNRGQETTDPREIRANKNERRRQHKLDEIDDELVLLEAENKLKAAKKEATGVPVTVTQKNANIFATIFAGKTPEQIKEITDDLTPEAIQKYNLMSAVPQDQNTAALMAIIGKKDTSVQDSVALIQAVTKDKGSNQMDLKGIAALMKEMRETAQPQTPATKESAIETAMKYIEPMFKMMSEKDQRTYEAQLKRVEDQIVDPIAYLKGIKEIAPTLGFVPAGQGGGVNMELEKMKLENDRWKTEQTWAREDRLEELGLKRQAEHERNKLVEKIATTALKRAGPAIDGLVNAAQRKMKGVGKSGSQPQSPPQPELPPNSFLCPDCMAKGKQTIIDATGMPEKVACPECKRSFEKGK